MKGDGEEEREVAVAAAVRGIRGDEERRDNDGKRGESENIKERRHTGKERRDGD